MDVPVFSIRFKRINMLVLEKKCNISTWKDILTLCKCVYVKPHSVLWHIWQTWEGDVQVMHKKPFMKSKLLWVVTFFQLKKWTLEVLIWWMSRHLWLTAGWFLTAGVSEERGPIYYSALSIAIVTLSFHVVGRLLSRGLWSLGVPK